MSDSEQACELSPGQAFKQGDRLQLRDDAMRQHVIEAAFDYRGDVTLVLRDGQQVEGYIFDRSGEAHERQLRIMPSDGSGRRNVRYVDVAELGFTGRDAAAGKSWETWVRKYTEKKQKGEVASIDSESLE